MPNFKHKKEERPKEPKKKCMYIHAILLILSEDKNFIDSNEHNQPSQKSY